MEHFHETQKMDQWWIKLIIAAIFILILGIFSTATYKQFAYEEAYDDKAMGGLALLAVSGLAIGIMSLIVAIFLNMKLELKVSRGMIQYKYWPYVTSWKTIEKSEIVSWEVVKYNPIFEYGGWGYRFRGLKNRAYTTKGNMGLKIEMANGHKKLFGTRIPIELTEAMSKMMQRNIVD
jgi:hypothetical protein